MQQRGGGDHQCETGERTEHRQRGGRHQLGQQRADAQWCKAHHPADHQQREVEQLVDQPAQCGKALRRLTDGGPEQQRCDDQRQHQGVCERVKRVLQTVHQQVADKLGCIGGRLSRRSGTQQTGRQAPTRLEQIGGDDADGDSDAGREGKEP